MKIHRVTLGARVIEVRWCQVDSAPMELGPLERALFERGKTEKRRAEFLAGRVAAHEAVSALGVVEPFEVLAQVGGEDDGRPVVMPQRGVAVSISHSSGQAVAIAARGEPIGVDLESAALSPDGSFAREAFAEGELARWDGVPAGVQHAKLALAWAAKEAVLKVWGVGLRAPLGLIGLRPGALVASEAGWRFSLGVEGPCPLRELDAWVGLVGECIAVIATSAHPLFNRLRGLAADAKTELQCEPVATAVRHGARPSKLPPRRSPSASS